MPLGPNNEKTYRVTVADATSSGVNSAVQNLSKVDEAFERIEKRESEVSREGVELRKAFDRVAKSADPLSRAQQRYNRDLDIAKKAMREGAASGDEYSRVLNGLNRRLATAENRAKGSADQFQSFGRTLRQVAGIAAAFGVGFSVGGLTREAVRTAADFEQQMAGVRAVTSATAEEMGVLSRQARDLGASTIFSARESAEAMVNLGRAGFDVGEIMQSVGGTLDLAAAGQLDLGRAAEISANALRGFNLEASESTKVSDILAKASVSSNQTVSDLGEALKFAAPTAVAFGVSVEETVASISKLADAGLKGGIGGRGFQAFVTRLEKNRDDIEAVIGDFDIQADGLTNILNKLGDAQISNARAIEFFGAENVDVYTNLRNAALKAAGGTDELTESLKNSAGAAREIAAVLFGTLNNAFKELGGAKEDLFIELAGAGALDALKKTINSVTESLRSPDAKAAAHAIGESFGTALDGIRENWSAVVDVTEAATAAAVAYGAASGAAAIGKAVIGLKARAEAVAENIAFDRAAVAAAASSAVAERELTATRVAELTAMRAQLNGTLELVTAQRAEAASRLELARGIAVATGARSQEAAAQLALDHSTDRAIQTRHALAAVEAELAAAETAAAAAARGAAVATGGLAAATGAVTSAATVGAGAAGSLAAAWVGLSTAAKASGAALAFASTGGIAGLAKVAPAIAKTTAAAAGLAALNFGRAIAQVTGLSAAFSFLAANPLLAIAAVTAGVVLLNKALDAQRIKDYDRAVRSAFKDAGAELPDRLKSGLDKSKDDLEKFEQDYRRILASIARAPRDEQEKELRDSALRGRGFSGGGLGNLITEQQRQKAADEARAREVAAQLAVRRERFGDVPLFASPRRTINDLKSSIVFLTDETRTFNITAEAAAAVTDVLAERQRKAKEAADAAADAEENLTKKIKEQKTAVEAQIARLRTLNEARAGGASDEEVKSLERRLDLQERYSELIAAGRQDLVDQLTVQENIATTQERTRREAEAAAEAQSRAAEEALRALQQQQQRFADSATDLMVDIWRSFRREGESAIDVIKRHFERAFDNVVGGFFQNIFDQIFVSTARAPGGAGGFGSAFSPASFAGSSITNALSGTAVTSAGASAPTSGLIGTGSPAAGFGGFNSAILGRPGPGAGGGLPFLPVGGLGSIFGKSGSLQLAGENLGFFLRQQGIGGLSPDLLGNVFRGGGTGFAISQGVNLAGSALGFGNRGNTGSTIGGTIGGIAGSFAGPIGTIVGSLIGSAIGKALGALVGGKPSNEAAGVQLDLGTFSTSNAFAKKNNEENIRTRDAIVEQTTSILQQLAELTGASFSQGAGLVVTAGKRNISIGGSFGQRSVAAGDAEGAVRAAVELAVQGLQGGEAALVSLTKVMARAGTPIEKITATIGKLSDVLKIDDAPVSQFAEALKTVEDAFATARAGAGALAGGLNDLAREQLSVTRAVAESFDESIARQTREITSPLEQQAIDLAKAQRGRLADATAISDAVESAAAAAGSGVAAAAAEAQQRLNAVIELNTEEWKQFIDQAATSADGMKAAAGAMDAMREQLLGLGVDLQTVEQQIGEVRAGIAAAFDQDIETRLTALTAPQEAAALELIKQQSDRIDAARAISGDAADEQQRLSKVIELNTAEWKALIEQASSTPEALSAAAAAIEKFAADAEALGTDPTLLRSQVATARSQLAATIDQDTAQRLLNIANPALAQFNQLLKEQQDRLKAGEAVGANVGGIERLNALERQKFLSGLSDKDRIGLGDFLGVIEDQSGRLSFVLSDLRLAFESQIAHVEDVTRVYDESAAVWKAANDNVRSGLADIRREFRGGNLTDQLAKAQQLFDSALATAGQAGLSDETRTAAQSQLSGLGREVLTLAREQFGTAPQFQSIFDRIESGLVGALGEGSAIAERAISQSEIAKQSLDALKRIDNALTQPTLELPVLEESRDRLAEISDGQTDFLTRLDELIELEKQRAAQAAFSVESLSGINQPLTASTGNPVTDAETAQQIASAVLRAGDATIAAIAAADGAEDDRHTELKNEITALKDEVAALVTLLRRIFGDETRLAA